MFSTISGIVPQAKACFPQTCVMGVLEWVSSVFSDNGDSGVYSDNGDSGVYSDIGVFTVYTWYSWYVFVCK